MSRPRIYASAAERQKAYRARQGSRTAPPATATRQRRPPSRPARLAALETAVRDLQTEYQAWLDSLPESLQDGAQADRLSEVIEQLELAAETLSDIQPPRGFGRD